MWILKPELHTDERLSALQAELVPGFGPGQQVWDRTLSQTKDSLPKQTLAWLGNIERGRNFWEPFQKMNSLTMETKENGSRQHLSFLTKVIVRQHLLNFLCDGIRIKLRGHCNHFLDAEARVSWYRQRSAKLRFRTWGILGQRFDSGWLWVERIPG